MVGSLDKLFSVAVKLTASQIIVFLQKVTKNTFIPGTICNEPAIANGAVTGPEIITPQSTLTIQCDTGYVMSHSDPVVCYSKDKFNPDPPQCLGESFVLVVLSSCEDVMISKKFFFNYGYSHSCLKEFS